MMMMMMMNNNHMFPFIHLFGIEIAKNIESEKKPKSKEKKLNPKMNAMNVFSVFFLAISGQKNFNLLALFFCFSAIFLFDKSSSTFFVNYHNG